MKRGAFLLYILSCLTGVFFCWNLVVREVRAGIASDQAFEGVTWEKILEDDLEGAGGIVQSMCVTDEYIICMENYAEATGEPDIVKAYYRNDTDENGDPVERYALAKRVQETDYEHANGMAYNPNTNEIAVALYTSYDPANRGCIYLMDADTLQYKSKLQIASDYNILGIDYDEENDRYVIQTDAAGGYSFKILDSSFQIIEDLGQYAGTAKGENFQDLCVSGDYIINFPLTLNMGIGDYINMYSISRKTLVSESQLDFQFKNVVMDEPEAIAELEPGVFLAAVNVQYTDGRRTVCLYKTMVPYEFDVGAEDKSDRNVDNTAEKSSESGKVNDRERSDDTKKSGSVLKNALRVVFCILFVLLAVFLMYSRHVVLERERQRKRDRARRERERIFMEEMADESEDRL